MISGLAHREIVHRFIEVHDLNSSNCVGQNKEKRFVQNKNTWHLLHMQSRTLPLRLDFLLVFLTNTFIYFLFIYFLKSRTTMLEARLRKSIVWIMFFGHGFSWAALMERKPERL